MLTLMHIVNFFFLCKNKKETPNLDLFPYPSPENPPFEHGLVDIKESFLSDSKISQSALRRLTPSKLALIGRRDLRE